MKDFAALIQLLLLLARVFDKVKRVRGEEWANNLTKTLNEIAETENDEEIFAATDRLVDLVSVRNKHKS